MSNLPSRFNAILARRSEPGHCPRCGRPYAGDGWCEACKVKHRAWKRAKRVEAAKTAEEAATIADVLLELRELRETVRIQAKKLSALTATARGHFDKGFIAGKMAEALAHENAPKEWDAWAFELDFTDKKQHCHRFSPTA